MPNPIFYYRDRRLYADSVDLTSLAQQVGTPCYVYSAARLLDNLQRLQGAFPQAHLHYSLKANANLSLIRLLAGEGIGFDAVSGGEIFRAVQAGVDPARLVFAGVGKTAHELHYALEQGIGWFNVESDHELRLLAQLAVQAGKRARVALRVNPDVQADTHQYIATGHSAAKFGIPLAEAEAILSGGCPEAVSIEGIHVHIGSQLGTAARTAEAVQAVLPLFDRFPQLRTLNVGGGFPVSYTGDPVPEVQEFAQAIHQALEGHTVELLLEPGRYIVADAGLLLVQVQYIKHTPQGVVAITDGGMTELIRPALYGATHEVLPLVEPDPAVQRHNTHIVGPVCESADVLRADVLLSPLHPGDLLAILHVGAYGAVMGSNYNARPRPPEILIEGAQWRIIRQRETWEQMIALERDSFNRTR